MRRGERHVEEERLLRLGRGLRHVGDGVVDDSGEDVDGLELRSRRAGAQPSLGRRGDLSGSTVLDPDERRHIERCADAEETVKAMVEGAILDVGRIIDWRPDLGARALEHTLIVGDPASLERERHPEVPFAEAGGAIALLLQKPRDGLAVRGDERGGITAKHAALQARTPMVATRQQAVAGRRADARSRVCIGETHPLGGQSVEVGRRNLPLRIIGRHVAQPLVVGQDHDDIRPIGRRGGQKGQKAEQRGEAHDGK